MTPDVREGVCFVVATSALSLPRHDGDPAPVDGDGRARPALDLQEIGGFAVVPSHHARTRPSSCSTPRGRAFPARSSGRCRCRSGRWPACVSARGSRSRRRASACGRPPRPPPSCETVLDEVALLPRREVVGVVEAEVAVRAHRGVRGLGEALNLHPPRLRAGGISGRSARRSNRVVGLFRTSVAVMSHLGRGGIDDPRGYPFVAPHG